MNNDRNNRKVVACGRARDSNSLESIGGDNDKVVVAASWFSHRRSSCFLFLVDGGRK